MAIAAPVVNFGKVKDKSHPAAARPTKAAAKLTKRKAKRRAKSIVQDQDESGDAMPAGSY